jgi:hypothetical protein
MNFVLRRVGHESTVVSYFAVGQTLKYADANGTELPENQQLETKRGTIYDSGSIESIGSLA